LTKEVPLRKNNHTTKALPTLADKAYNVLKAAIMEGEIEEGCFLSERDARKKFRIGRTPFREACNRLHYEQLLKVVPRRGYLVPEMSYQDVQDVLEVRTTLETAIADIVCARATAEQIEALYELVRQPFPMGGEGYLARITINREFHLLLAQMTHNRELVRIAKGILERTARVVYLIGKSFPDRADEFMMNHEPIIKAIRDRDPIATRKAILDDISGSPLSIKSPQETTARTTSRQR
jgi:DNA-binding GntR family transcriptional regulator